jgi:30S ribosomal protein 3
MKKFVLKFLWLNNCISVSLDQKVGEKTIPITPYFSWPSRDAWDEMRVYFDSKNWIPDSEAVVFLNRITEIINYWQDREISQRIDIKKIREKFPDCLFIGYN